MIKPRKDLKDEVIKKLKALPTSLLRWDQRYVGMLDTLLEEFHEIVEMTISCIENYDELKKIRAQIEPSRNKH